MSADNKGNRFTIASTIVRRSVIVLALVAGVVLVCSSLWTDGTDLAPAHTSDSNAPAPPATVTVYVTGAVRKPGVVALPATARVEDAIAACGGFSISADATRLALAAPLADAMRIEVPFKTDETPASDGNRKPKSKPTALGDGELINLNIADETELTRLPGVGPKTAQLILDFRATHGSFKTIEDLKKIKGIGDKRFAKIKDMVTVGE